MTSISMAFASRCIKIACVEGEWFGYISVSSIDEEDYHNIGRRDSYMEGDDDDDGDYDYAPAA
ncbi:hypothetical protein L195_g024394 [Trifolium pratense]|uniref:Uncharacterized protein n=1 Tax=Trifolium pratense TaxID=57577 RepID=A0A2K3NDI8_TRIPR|nr:hypothetical protein L195_g024394 [Trifolium pratense]